MIIHKANYSYLHVAIRQKTKFLIYVNHIYKFMLNVYYGFGYEREVKMKKALFMVVLCLSVSAGLCYAEDLNGVFRGIRNGINTFSDVNKLKQQIQQPQIQTPQSQTETKTAPTNDSSAITNEPTSNVQDLQQKPVEVSFFAGLKPDSSILDVINTFKNYESVTNIKVSFGEKVISDNNKPVNFKTAYCDKATMSKYLEQTIPDGLYNKRYGYKMDDYTKLIDLTNGKQGKIIGLTDNIYINIDKMYIDGIPCSVEAKFTLSGEFYSLHPEKVFIGPNKHIAYPYIIETITFNTDYYDKSVQGIAEQKREGILNKYIQKYGVVKDQSCYEGDHCNNFVAIKFHPNFGITYKNYTYINELAAKYNDFKMKTTIQESKKFDSSNDI